MVGYPFTDYYIKNTVPDPILGTPVERTYGGLVISPNTSRQINSVDIGILQSDLVFLGDLTSGLVIISFVSSTGANPVDLSGLDAVSAVESLGTNRSFQSVVFQRRGFISLPQLATQLSPFDPGGVWLKVGSLSSDVSPPAVYSTPKSIKLIVSWFGSVLPKDTVSLLVYMRKTQNDVWNEVTVVNLAGSISQSSYVDLTSFNLGTNSQIAVRIAQGVVKDVFCTVVVSS